MSTKSTSDSPHTIHPTGEATGILPARGDRGTPITVIGTQAIRDSFDDNCLEQALNARSAPGVEKVILNPDAHLGHGAPIGCVMVSPSHIFPGPVGVDIKCSMSLLQLDVPEDAVADAKTRRAIIDAICERTPTGPGKGQRHVPKARHVDDATGRKAVTEGASHPVCESLGIPLDWVERCEDSVHTGPEDSSDVLEERLEHLMGAGRFPNGNAKFDQLGSYGGGNHFGECEIVRLADDSPETRTIADTFGLVDGHAAFLSHCGSRGFGHALATGQFHALQAQFESWHTPFPSNDRHLVYAPLGTPEADAYLDDMALGANFATVNHLLINALVLEAFQEVLPGTMGRLVYSIGHNIAREEVVDGHLQWVHRKGATRALPGGHQSLANTPFRDTGHPILLPGNPRDGSVVMTALPGAEKTAFSVNHGAGRRMGRRDANRQLDQDAVDADFQHQDILTNCRKYPRDEAPDAYKDFKEVLRSVEAADLARTVARLDARFVIKDGSGADD